MRGLLLSAAASIRKGDDIECIMTMRQVTAVFSPFPPPPRTPEMEMVAAALEPMSSTTERDQLLVPSFLHTLAACCGDCIAETLG